MFEDLKHAQESLVIDNYLHLLYLITPYDLVSNVYPNWMIYMDEVNKVAYDILLGYSYYKCRSMLSRDGSFLVHGYIQIIFNINII